MRASTHRAVRVLASKATNKDMSKRIRLLCLHGYENSGPILKKQLEWAGWCEQFGDLCEFECISAPFPAQDPVSPIVARYFPEDPKCSWFQKIHNDASGGVTYRGKEKSIELISNTFRDKGPFDGLLGFSQGAAVSLVVAAMQQDGRLLQNFDPLKLCIFIAGFRSRDKDHIAMLDKFKLDCPTLHIWGEKDQLKQGCEAAVDCCSSRAIVERHPAGHKVPNVSTIDSQRIRSWLEASSRSTGPSFSHL